MLSTAFSVASFSIVLAESFAAIGLSTLVPAVFAESASALKQLHAANPSPTEAQLDNELGRYSSIFDMVGGDKGKISNPRDMANALLKAVAKSADSINLLVPNKASLDAEFEFHAAESYKADASVGAMIEVVTVKAGFGELYETSSSNKIKLHVDFALAEFKL
jgi:hypothetical protein